MYKRDDYYYSRIQPILLMKEMDENYQAETDLVRSIMKECISEMIVRTRHELALANEELWYLFYMLAPVSVLLQLLGMGLIVHHVMAELAQYRNVLDQFPTI